MTENDKSAGMHMFGVPDERAAVMIAQALARFGFASVTVHSSSATETLTAAEWEVTALDDGPYSDEEVSTSAWTAIHRYATAIAARHGGREIGATRCALMALQQKRLGAAHIFEFDSLVQSA